LTAVTRLFWSRMTPFSIRLTISRGIAAAVALRVWTKVDLSLAFRPVAGLLSRPPSAESSCPVHGSGHG
jgi:hypothetical protein